MTIRSAMLQFVITDVQMISRLQISRHKLLIITTLLIDVNKLKGSGSVQL
jgi:hypothetical protein